MAGERIHPPAPNPCGSCPYRLDVPSGVWDTEEYEKLPSYDKETGDQHPSVFMCHQQNGAMCAGWCGTHDMQESLGLRLAVGLGLIAEEDYDAILDYTTSTPLFASGAEAAEHGLAELEKPSEKAVETIGKLKYKQRRRERN